MVSLWNPYVIFICPWRSSITDVRDYNRCSYRVWYYMYMCEFMRLHCLFLESLPPPPPRRGKANAIFAVCCLGFSIIFLCFLVSLFFFFFWRQRPVYEVFVVGVPTNYSLRVCHGKFSYIRSLLKYVLDWVQKKSFIVTSFLRNKINLILQYLSFYIIK
jgi:fatty acid desaturase